MRFRQSLSYILIILPYLGLLCIMERGSYRFRHAALSEAMQTLNDVNERANNCVTDELLTFRDERRLAAAKRMLLASDDGELLDALATVVTAAAARMLEKGLHQVLDQQRHMVSAMAKSMGQAVPLVGEVRLTKLNQLFCHHF